MNQLPVIHNFSNSILELLQRLHLPEQVTALMHLILMLAVFIALSWILDKLLNLIFISILRKASRKSFRELADLLIRNKTMRRLAHFIPLVLLTGSIPVIFSRFPGWIIPFQIIAGVLMTLLLISLMNKIFRSLTDLAKEKPGFRDKPMDSYFQVINIILLFVGGILIYSQITGKPVWAFFTAMGAVSAILLLMFKDTIMGFVASIQVSTNDMVRMGDWIEMPKYGADGSVIAITLTTVKVRNFDFTITTIPTYALISDSFKNWRGMQQSGGRRMKRSINLKIASVRFLTDADIERFSQIGLVKDYLATRSDEIRKYNLETNADRSVLLNGRNLTNIGVFRQYIIAYLKNNPNVHPDKIMMVRQLAPGEYGIPMEIYAFATTVVWAEYEAIMSDIFDHIMVAAGYFDLEIFEVPSGRDLRAIMPNPSQGQARSC